MSTAGDPIAKPQERAAWSNRYDQLEIIHPLKRKRAWICDNTDKLRRQRATWSKPGRAETKTSWCPLSVKPIVKQTAQLPGRGRKKWGDASRGHKVSGLQDEKSSQSLEMEHEDYKQDCGPAVCWWIWSSLVPPKWKRKRREKVGPIWAFKYTVVWIVGNISQCMLASNFGVFFPNFIL